LAADQSYYSLSVLDSIYHADKNEAHDNILGEDEGEGGRGGVQGG